MTASALPPATLQSRVAGNRGWIGLAVRLILAAVWGWAALSKIGDPRRFVQAVRAYQATPEWLSSAIGDGLPVLESSIAILLLIGLITRYAAVVGAVLLVLFTIGLVQVSARGIKIECGCFGGGGTTSSTSYLLDILRDLVLLVLAAYLIRWPLTRLSVDEAILRSELVPALTGKQQRNEKAQRRYRSAVVAAEVELRHKQRFIAAGTAIAVLLIGLIGIGVQSGRAKITGTTDLTNASATTGARVGNQQAPITVDLYEDFQCPVCNNLEQTLGTDLAAKVTARVVKVNYHVMSFLDAQSSGNRYSSRAANAGYCASDVSAAVFAKFHGILFGKDSKGVSIQPAENSHGRTNTELIAYGKQAGASSADFISCVTGEADKSLVAAVTDNASKKGVTGTPTVYVNGSVVKGSNGASVATADVDAAIAAGLKTAKSQAAPSPTPSKASGAVSSPAVPPVSVPAASVPAASVSPAVVSPAVTVPTTAPVKSPGPPASA